MQSHNNFPFNSSFNNLAPLRSVLGPQYDYLEPGFGRWFCTLPLITMETAHDYTTQRLVERYLTHLRDEAAQNGTSGLNQPPGCHAPFNHTGQINLAVGQAANSLTQPSTATPPFCNGAGTSTRMRYNGHRYAQGYGHVNTAPTPFFQPAPPSTSFSHGIAAPKTSKPSSYTPEQPAASSSALVARSPVKAERQISRAQLAPYASASAGPSISGRVTGSPERSLGRSPGSPHAPLTPRKSDRAGSEPPASRFRCSPMEKHYREWVLAGKPDSWFSGSQADASNSSPGKVKPSSATAATNLSSKSNNSGDKTPTRAQPQAPTQTKAKVLERSRTIPLRGDKQDEDADYEEDESELSELSDSEPDAEISDEDEDAEYMPPSSRVTTARASRPRGGNLRGSPRKGKPTAEG